MWSKDEAGSSFRTTDGSGRGVPRKRGQSGLLPRYLPLPALVLVLTQAVAQQPPAKIEVPVSDRSPLTLADTSQQLNNDYENNELKGVGKMGLTISSKAFRQNGKIPALYTCDGDDLSPPLSWSGLPAGTKSLALIVDDPDAPDPAAPKMTWVHWVLYNIPPQSDGLPEGASNGDLPKGTLEGLNGWKRTRFGGPCPPIGRHRYFHKLYALDLVLPNMRRPTKAELERAMQGHVLAHAELVGTYQRAR